MRPLLSPNLPPAISLAMSDSELVQELRHDLDEDSNVEESKTFDPCGAGLSRQRPPPQLQHHAPPMTITAFSTTGGGNATADLHGGGADDVSKTASAPPCPWKTSLPQPNRSNHTVPPSTSRCGQISSPGLRRNLVCPHVRRPLGLLRSLPALSGNRHQSYAPRACYSLGRSVKLQ